MRAFVKLIVSAVAAIAFVVPGVAFAQSSSQAPSSAPPKLISYRGLQMGVDVTAGRQGEAGFYFGASGNHGMLGVRFSAMDPGASVPCSVGVMYEHLFSKDRARITPVAGAALGRVFSCAEESDGIRPAPAIRRVGTFSAGVRIPMFAGHRVVGALKVLAFSQRQFGENAASDVTSRGVSVGFVIGRR